MSIKLTVFEARSIVLHAQLLNNATNITADKNGIYEIIDHLGYVQLDTLSVVQRAHHHTLWNRHSDYKQDMLLELQRDDKLIFEYWGHAASYLPMKDFRFYQHRMNKADDPNSKWEKERLEKYGYLLDPVMKQVREKGPCQSKDIELPNITFKQGKHFPNPTTQVRFALNMLVFRGQLMISERKKFQKYYDLTERVLPSHIDTTFPIEQELGRFLVTRALKGYGIASARGIKNHIFLAGNGVLQNALNEMISSREVVKVNIADDTTEYFAFPKTLENFTSIPAPTRTMLIFPFDNLIIQRDRLKRLFGFNYALECYVTPSKRVDGYFVCPILWKDRFVGRLDPKADRKKKQLILKNIFFEEGFDEFEEFLPSFANTLIDFMKFNGCEEILIDSIRPEKLLKKLKSLKV